jgi:hypothetical protein
MKETFLARATTVKAAVALVVVGGCAIVAGVALTGASISACSSERGSSSSGPESPSSTSSSPIDDSDPGSIGLRLTIGNGVNLYSLSYTCTGPSPIPPGTVNFNDAQSVEYVLGGITPGSGYQCTLTGFDSNGDSCTGTTTQFSVLSGQVSNAGVVVTCTVPTDAAIAADVNVGSTYFDAAVQLVNIGPNGCPGISAFSVSPAEVTGPQPSQLSVTEVGSQSGIGADGGPSSSNIAWSASCSVPPCGTFYSSDGGLDGTSANPTFVCGPAAQLVTINVQITQYETTLTPGGPVTTSVCNGVPFTSMTSTINCEGNCYNMGYGTACGDAGQVCNGGGTCVVPSFEVLRVGNGSAALTTAATPVFIDQYALDGGPAGASIALPTTAGGSSNALTLIGTDNSQGDLTTSADGRYLALAGYNVSAGTTTPPTGSTIVATINAAGTINPTPVPTAFVDGGVVRSAASLDGNEVWVTGTAVGASGGLWYSPPAAQLFQAATSTSPGQARWIRIAGGQLYGDTDHYPPGFVAVGTGTPTSGSQTLTTLPGTPDSGTMTANPSPWGFVFFDLNPAVTGLDTLYIADDRATSSGGGLVKFQLLVTGGTWTKQWEMQGTGANGYRGLAGYATGTTVTLMATTGAAGGQSDTLVAIVDPGGSVSTVTQTNVANAPLNTTFRGVALPPHP